jgi:hypothetical protein
VLSCPVNYLRLMAPTQGGNLRALPEGFTNSVVEGTVNSRRHSRARPNTYGPGSGTVIMNPV